MTDTQPETGEVRVYVILEKLSSDAPGVLVPHSVAELDGGLPVDELADPDNLLSEDVYPHVVIDDQVIWRGDERHG